MSSLVNVATSLKRSRNASPSVYLPSAAYMPSLYVCTNRTRLYQGYLATCTWKFTVSKSHSAIALGGNLGGPLALFRMAIRELSRSGVVTAVSRVYETEPVGGPPGQPNYYNQ